MNIAPQSAHAQSVRAAMQRAARVPALPHSGQAEALEKARGSTCGDMRLILARVSRFRIGAFSERITNAFGICSRELGVQGKRAHGCGGLFRVRAALVVSKVARCGRTVLPHLVRVYAACPQAGADLVALLAVREAHRQHCIIPGTPNWI